MKKSITICFRTDQKLRVLLETAAREDKRTMSAAIERILTDYLEKNRGFSDRVLVERRRYPRKQVTMPAYVEVSGANATRLSAVILDLSLGGMRVSIPKEYVSKIYKWEKESSFAISFTLPSEKKPVRVQCSPQRLIPSNGNAYLGVRFVDAEFESYQRIQQYLV